MDGDGAAGRGGEAMAWMMDDDDDEAAAGRSASPQAGRARTPTGRERPNALGRTTPRPTVGRPTPSSRRGASGGGGASAASAGARGVGVGGGGGARGGGGAAAARRGDDGAMWGAKPGDRRAGGSDDGAYRRRFKPVEGSPSTKLRELRRQASSVGDVSSPPPPSPRRTASSGGLAGTGSSTLAGLSVNGQLGAWETQAVAVGEQRLDLSPSTGTAQQGVVGSQLREWLGSLELAEHADVVVTAGYGSVQDLALADDEEIRSLAKACGWRKPEMRRLMGAIGPLRQERQETGGTVVQAASCIDRQAAKERSDGRASRSRAANADRAAMRRAAATDGVSSARPGGCLTVDTSHVSTVTTVGLVSHSSRVSTSTYRSTADATPTKSSPVRAAESSTGAQAAISMPSRRAGSGHDEMTATAVLLVDGKRVACSLGRWSAQTPALKLRYSGTVVATKPPRADAELINASALMGSVALAKRGGCPLADKAQRAAAAGAVALLVSDTKVAATPLKPRGTERSPIPVLGVHQSVHATLAAAGESVVVLTIVDAEEQQHTRETLAAAGERGVVLMTADAKEQQVPVPMLQELFTWLDGSEQVETLVLDNVRVDGEDISGEDKAESTGNSRAVGAAGGQSTGGDEEALVDMGCVHRALRAVGVAVDAALIGSLVNILEGHKEQSVKDLDPKERLRRWYNDAMEALRQQVVANTVRSVTIEQWKQSFLRVASDKRGMSAAVNVEEFVSAVRFSVTTQARRKFSTKPLPAWPHSLNDRKQQVSAGGARAVVIHSSVVCQLFRFLDQARTGKVDIVECVCFFAGKRSARPSSETNAKLFDRCWELLSMQQQLLDVKSVSRNLFSVVDPSSSGYISRDQLRKALKKKKVLLSERDLKALEAALDNDEQDNHVSTSSFERNLRDAKRRCDQSRSPEKGHRLNIVREHEQQPPASKPPFAEWEVAAAQRCVVEALSRPVAHDAISVSREPHTKLCRHDLEASPTGYSVRTVSVKTVADTDNESPVSSTSSPQPGCHIDDTVLDPGLCTVEQVKNVNEHETIETFSHRAKGPALWAVRAGLHAIDCAVSFQSREHAMARAVWQRVQEVVRRKQTVCGESPQTPADVFRVFDSDGSGKLSSDELSRAVVRLGLGYTSPQIHTLFDFLDVNGDGAIDYRGLVVFFGSMFGSITGQRQNAVGHEGYSVSLARETAAVAAIVETEQTEGSLPVHKASRRRKQLQEQKAWRDKVAALDQADAQMEIEMQAAVAVAGTKQPPDLTRAGAGPENQTVDERDDTLHVSGTNSIADSNHAEHEAPALPQQQRQQGWQHSRQAMLAKRKSYLRRMQERQLHQ